MEKSKSSLLEITDNTQSQLPDTKYMGSKQALLPFIFECLKGLRFDRVLEPFSGTACVAYAFKKLGKEVHANDFLHFCFQTANAVIANNNVVLSNADITFLLRKNPRRSSFVQDTFGNRYFSAKENLFLDNLRANIDELRNPLKRSLAIAAVSRACMKKRPRGIFTFTGRKGWDGRRDLKLSLEDQFIAACKAFNDAVFNNGEINRAFNLDVFALEPTSYDLVYIDTPYISPYSDCDYVRRYHFVEGYSKYWDGIEISQDSVTKKFKSYPTAFSSQRTAEQAFLRLFEHFKKSTLVISYSSNSVPSKREMIRLLRCFKKNVVCHEVAYKYCFGNHAHRVGDNKNNVHEYLFVAQ